MDPTPRSPASQFLVRGLAVVAAAAWLAACQTVDLTGSTSGDITEDSPASPANLASLSDVIARNPNDPQAYNVRGAVYGRAGKHQEALADFDKAIALDPNFAQAYANRGVVHRQMNRLDLALADFNRALEIDPGYGAAYLGRGMVYRRQNQPLEALNDFNRAIERRADDAEAHYQRGLLYQAQSQHQYAIDDFTAAIRLSRQQNADALLARGLSRLALGDQQAAAADLDQAVQLAPQSASAWASRGLAYERLGDKDKAAGSYARALTIDQRYEPAKTGFARVGGRSGQAYQTF